MAPQRSGPPEKPRKTAKRNPASACAIHRQRPGRGTGETHSFPPVRQRDDRTATPRLQLADHLGECTRELMGFSPGSPDIQQPFTDNRPERPAAHGPRGPAARAQARPGNAGGRPPHVRGDRPPVESSDSLTGCTDRSRSPPAERPGRSRCRTASSRCRRSRRPSTSRPWPPRWARPGCCGSGTDPYRPG